jgi:hypothetical protein
MRLMISKVAMLAFLATAPLAGMAVTDSEADALCWKCISHSCTLVAQDGSSQCAQLESFPWCQLSGFCVA